jgi:carbamoyl-phosphate synthase large subunit
MNILITSAGRRVSLLRFAQETLKRHYPSSIVHAIDLNPQLSAACHIADKTAKAPRVTDPSYGDFLLDYCLKERIGLVLPTIDTELSVLAEYKEIFADHNITIAVSDKTVCDTFYRKRSTHDFFKAHGFNTPSIVNNLQESSYPLFAKLDNSSCSIGAQRVNDVTEAKQLLSLGQDYVFQELIEGDEYTVDFYVTKSGEPAMILPRKRIEVRAGEVSKSVTCKDNEIIREVKKLCTVLKGSWGPMTLQLFKTPDQQLVLIEINPRVGGGYPLSHHAGMNIFDLLIREIQGEAIEYSTHWEDRLTMLRYDAEVIIHEN